MEIKNKKIEENEIIEEKKTRIGMKKSKRGRGKKRRGRPA
jgi:hypothetical protein